MQKIIASFLVAATLLGSGGPAMTVKAGTCPPHDFKNREYLNSYTTPDSHTYVYAKYDSGKLDIRTCHFQHLWVTLKITCAYCNLDSGETTTDYYGERGHVCTPTRE